MCKLWMMKLRKSLFIGITFTTIIFSSGCVSFFENNIMILDRIR